MAGKRRRLRMMRSPDSSGRGGDTNAAPDVTSAASAADSPPAESPPAKSNPYGPQDPSGGYETPDDVRAAGLSPELPCEAPDPDDADITYADGQTFFEKFPELLRG